jgi:hypothetical protein
VLRANAVMDALLNGKLHEKHVFNWRCRLLPLSIARRRSTRSGTRLSNYVGCLCGEFCFFRSYMQVWDSASASDCCMAQCSHCSVVMDALKNSLCSEIKTIRVMVGRRGPFCGNKLMKANFMRRRGHSCFCPLGFIALNSVKCVGSSLCIQVMVVLNRWPQGYCNNSIRAVACKVAGIATCSSIYRVAALWSSPLH